MFPTEIAKFKNWWNIRKKYVNFHRNVNFTWLKKSIETFMEQYDYRRHKLLSRNLQNKQGV